jgi:aminomethyltransferase
MLLATPLHAAHRALNAKMGAFAGYDMPLYYEDGVVKEHEWVRSQAGLFDVSHMGQIIIAGTDADAFLETVTPSSYASLPAGRAKYTILTNERGGIVDDLIVTRLEDGRYFAVINAGCKEKDIGWLTAQLDGDVILRNLHDRALLALQGPAAESVLREVFKIDTSSQPYMWLEKTALPGIGQIFVSRVGYTGEDGFELSIPAGNAAAMWEALCAHKAVKPIGLAARDSLRLEMGYCLYGHDIDENTTPVEAELSWVFGKENDSFIGADIIRRQGEQGPSRRRTGIRLLDKGIVREGAFILDEGGRPVGKVTSGGFSPTLKTAIAQGYVETALAAPGTKLLVDIRGRPVAAESCAMPFVPARTRSMKKQAA